MMITCMEAKHEEADVLDEHRDQPKEKPRWHRYQGVTPLWQDLLLGTDEVDNNWSEDEAVEEHDGFEASVAEEGAHHPEHEVERAHRGGVGVILPDDLHVLLQIVQIPFILTKPSRRKYRHFALQAVTFTSQKSVVMFDVVFSDVSMLS